MLYILQNVHCSYEREKENKEIELDAHFQRIVQWPICSQYYMVYLYCMRHRRLYCLYSVHNCGFCRIARRRFPVHRIQFD